MTINPYEIDKAPYIAHLKEASDHAFGFKLTELKVMDNDQLASLLRLQHAVCQNLSLYKFFDLSGLVDTDLMEKRLRSVVRQILSRIEKSDDITVTGTFIDALSLVIRLAGLTKPIEKVFKGFIKSAMALEQVPADLELPISKAFAVITGLHCSLKEINYFAGRQLVASICDKWFASVAENGEWRGVDPSICIGRVALFNDYDYYSHFKKALFDSKKIQGYYLYNADYDRIDLLCESINARFASPLGIEKETALGALEVLKEFGAENLSFTDRCLVEVTTLNLLSAIFGDEAEALSLIPESARYQYIELVKPRDYASLSMTELMRLGRQCNNLLDILDGHEDNFVEPSCLQIGEVAREICIQLIVRADDDIRNKEKMLRLADCIGFIPKEYTQNREIG